MTSRGAAKKKPEYPAWSMRCDHSWGIPLNEAYQQLTAFGCVEDFRAYAERVPRDAPESVQKDAWKPYWMAVRQNHRRFTSLVVSDHLFVTGIRYPYAENRVREEIPPELFIQPHLHPDKNQVTARGPHNERVVYVEVLVSVRFWHSPHYELVRVRDKEFPLNATQAAIVQRLHKAALEGRDEGLVAKQLLADVGKKSGDLGDYFKDHHLWHYLITMVRPGRYRLAAYGLGFQGYG